ncbi:hypothetical protein QBC35DRAFT_555315 [Podospora australis]|uniref:Uncharacterized protein n=1 Tax=Podospora australis TaxID=1536484 RepID=A0AAN6WPZ5_9PEZI|nr:hypothetical protein QBC35DRAFT_555315 [Podospora australis]
MDEQERLTLEREAHHDRHKKFHYLWAKFASYYSSRALTVKGDRVMALEGVRERLQTRLGSECVYGHWIDADRAPSWSWIAAERTISYGYLEFDDKDEASQFNEYEMKLTSALQPSSSIRLWGLRDTSDNERLPVGFGFMCENVFSYKPGPNHTFAPLQPDFAELLNASQRVEFEIV